METKAEYYSRRATEELRAAACATSPEAQVSHRTLAEHYAVIVRESENQPSAKTEKTAKAD